MAFCGFDSPVFLAPMAGVTDRPFRQILASCGKGNMYAEMAAINALQRKNPKSWQIADVRTENYPVVVQLVGNDAELFAEAAKLVSELGARSLDINMGCPVKKIVNNESGSALMKDMVRASKIINAVVKATPLSVSVKFRKGWDNEHINAVDFAKMCEESGASYITVHGRTRAQGYSGEADWNIIKAVKENVKIPVIGNGDIDSPQKAKQRMLESGVDGVMIGRAVLGNPWLLAQTHNYLCHNQKPDVPTIVEIKKMLLKHLHLLIEYYGEKAGMAVSRKHVGWYLKGVPCAAAFRGRVNQINDAAALREAIRGI